MPTKKNNFPATKDFLVDEKSPFLITEAFRQLMSNISFAVPKKEAGLGKLICISSALSHEGKTTTSSNIAITFSTAGYKTVLVDCDMRKPKIRKMFNLPKGKGLVDYLSGHCEFKDILHKEVRSNLDVIPTFKTAPNPNALFNSEEFTKLFDELAKTYDYVIVDTPPISVVSDGVIVGKHCDGVILVTRPYYSDHKTIQIAINNIEFAEVNFLGFVVNDLMVDSGKKKGYYKKYYKYGYSYKSRNSGTYGYGVRPSAEASESDQPAESATTEEPSAPSEENK